MRRATSKPAKKTPWSNALPADVRQAHAAHQTLCPFAVDTVATAPQVHHHLPAAVKRVTWVCVEQAHKAVHEPHVAAEVIAGELQGNKELATAAFNARVIPSVAYTDPEVAWVGLTEDQAKAQGIKVKKGLFPWTALGRAIANGRDEGVTKLLFDDSPEARGHGKILGGGVVGTHAGEGESIGMAAEVAHGSFMGLPPARK